MIRSVVVLVGGATLTFFHACRVLIQPLFGRAGLACFCDGIARRWCRRMLRLAGVRVELRGTDERDWSGPAVVVANHQSWFDVFTIAAYLPGRVRFVAKKELGRIPVFGPAWKTCGHISIDRSNRRRAIASLDHAAERVRDESLTIVLFPEGTRSPDGALHDFKKGAFVLAIKSSVPIVPVAITGSRDVMPKGSWRVTPGVVQIRVGQAIDADGFTHADRDRLRELSQTAVGALLRASTAAVENGESPPAEPTSGQPGGPKDTIGPTKPESKETIE